MSKENTAALKNEGAPGFDWAMYDGGYNGKSLKRNKKVQIRKTDTGITVLSHEKYAASVYRKYLGEAIEPKEIKSGDVLKITDLTPLTDNTVMATVKNGANNIIIDLEKEAKFLSNISIGDTVMTKETFNACIRNQAVKNELLKMDLAAKVGTDESKASIWDGFVTNLTKELHEQLIKPTRGYMAYVISANDGGLIVEISKAIKAFLPGSLISSSKLSAETDYESYIGKYLEVMVEDYRYGRGFIVSRKKFIQAVQPAKIAKLVEQLDENPEMCFRGKITGNTKFGIFVQLDEYITGMLHKSLVSDLIRQEMRDNTIDLGSEIDVYVHRIEDNRVILSDVPLNERDAIIAAREAEDEAEKAAYAEEMARLEAEQAALEKAEADAYIESLASTIGMANPLHADLED